MSAVKPKWDIQKFQALLTRGTRVRVRKSCGKKKYRGKEVIVASQRLAQCNEKSAANEEGPGKAVFVALPEEFPDDGEKGWLKGTTKIGIHHLELLDGTPVVPPLTSVDAGTPPAASATTRPFGPPSGPKPDVTSPANIRRVLSHGLPNELASMVTSLWEERDALKTRLIAALEDNNRLLRERADG